jgi:hypothetical protein
MHPHPGHSAPVGHACRLRRSHYGLKQAPRVWFEHFTSVFTVVGFVASQHDSILFIHTFPMVVPLFFSMWMICSSEGMILTIFPLLRLV